MTENLKNQTFAQLNNLAAVSEENNKVIITIDFDDIVNLVHADVSRLNHNSLALYRHEDEIDAIHYILPWDAEVDVPLIYYVLCNAAHRADSRLRAWNEKIDISGHVVRFIFKPEIRKRGLASVVANLLTQYLYCYALADKLTFVNENLRKALENEREELKSKASRSLTAIIESLALLTA